MVAGTDASTTNPTTPAGWTQVVAGTGTGQAFVVSWKIAASSSETSGTWTGATSLAYVMYRGASATAPLINPSGQTGTGSTTISYSGLVSFANPAVDWVLCCSLTSNQTAAANTHPPTSTTAVANYGDASQEITIYDTGAAVSSYSFNTKTLSAAVNSTTKTLELVAATGGGTPTNLFFF